jgi:WXG100 protein secretion system (Wss), protein YukD
MSSAVMPIVRVAILADSRLTEIALPADLPLREILPAVERLVVPAIADDATANGDASAEPTTPTRRSLAPIGGAPFSLDASLGTVGVVDGDLLALQPIPAGPAAPGIVEDIADAAVIFSTSRLKPWGTIHIQRGAVAGFAGLIWVATGLGVVYRFATGSVVGSFVVGAIALLTVLAGLATRSPRAGAAISAAALVPIAAALALAVPGSFGTAQVTLGAGLLVVALLVTIEAPQLSALWARFPLPVIPAPGDPTPSAPSSRVLEDLPRRVRISDAHQTGFIAGAVLLSVIGSVAIAWRPETLSAWGWYVVAATAAAATLRARVWDSAACKAWLLAQPFLVTVSLVVLYTATAQYLTALVIAIVLAVLVSAWVVVALSPSIASPDTYSLPLCRLVGFVASGIDASLIPVIAYLVGVFTWVLNR